MKIHQNLNVYQKNTTTENEVLNESNIFAGDLNMPADRIFEKKLSAQEKAMNLIKNAFYSDLKIDDDLEKRRKRTVGLLDDYGSNIEELSRIKERINEINQKLDNIQLSEEDKEQELEDMKLLRLYQNLKLQSSIDIGGSFSSKDLAMIDKLTKSISDFQLYHLELDSLQYLQKELSEKNEVILSEIIMENRIITSIMNAREQYRPLLEASEAAEEILNAVSNEVIDMITEDAVYKIKKDSEEAEEKAKKIEEKQKELNELLKKIRKDQKDEAENIERILEMTKELLALAKESTKIQGDVKKMLGKLNLIDDDLKGVKVDQIA